MEFFVMNSVQILNDYIESNAIQQFPNFQHSNYFPGKISQIWCTITEYTHIVVTRFRHLKVIRRLRQGR